jgi:hypothetical protein
VLRSLPSLQWSSFLQFQFNEGTDWCFGSRNHQNHATFTVHLSLECLYGSLVGLDDLQYGVVSLLNMHTKLWCIMNVWVIMHSNSLNVRRGHNYHHTLLLILNTAREKKIVNKWKWSLPQTVGNVIN